MNRKLRTGDVLPSERERYKYKSLTLKVIYANLGTYIDHLHQNLFMARTVNVLTQEKLDIERSWKMNVTG